MCKEKLQSCLTTSIPTPKFHNGLIDPREQNFNEAMKQFLSINLSTTRYALAHSYLATIFIETLSKGLF